MVVYVEHLLLHLIVDYVWAPLVVALRLRVGWFTPAHHTHTVNPTLHTLDFAARAPWLLRAVYCRFGYVGRYARLRWFTDTRLVHTHTPVGLFTRAVTFADARFTRLPRTTVTLIGLFYRFVTCVRALRCYTVCRLVGVTFITITFWITEHVTRTRCCRLRCYDFTVYARRARTLNLILHRCVCALVTVTHFGCYVCCCLLLLLTFVARRYVVTICCCWCVDYVVDFDTHVCYVGLRLIYLRCRIVDCVVDYALITAVVALRLLFCYVVTFTRLRLRCCTLLFTHLFALL